MLVIVEFCGLLFFDSGYLQEEEVCYVKYKGYFRYVNFKLFYMFEDVCVVLELFWEMLFDWILDFGNGILVCFIFVGYLFGVVQIQVIVDGWMVYFSGDVGCEVDLLMCGFCLFEGVDIFVIEFIYGNCMYGYVDLEQEFVDVINWVVWCGGVIVILVFVVGWIQGVMLQIVQLCEWGVIFYVLVYFNSLMGVDVIVIYYNYYDEYYVSWDDCKVMFDFVECVCMVEELKEFNCCNGLMIIIFVSGMFVGGCVLYYLVSFGFDFKNVIVLSGFQVGGMRGVVFVRGGWYLWFFGCEIDILVEVIQFEGMFGYVDVDELLFWMWQVKFLEIIYVIYGEFDSVDVLCYWIDYEFGWRVCVLEYFEWISLECLK